MRNRDRRAQAARLRHRHLHPQHPDRAAPARREHRVRRAVPAATTSRPATRLGRNFRHGRRRRRRAVLDRRADPDSVALARERVDLVHEPHYVLPPLTRCRSVVTIHDCIHLMFPQYLPESAGATSTRAARCGRATRQADRILTVSEASKRDILRFFDVPPEKVQVIYNAIDERFLTPPDAERRWIGCAQRYQLDHPFVLYVGNIKPHKNIERLIDAFGRARRDGPEDLKLVIIGDEISKYPSLRQIGASPQTRQVRPLPRLPAAGHARRRSIAWRARLRLSVAVRGLRPAAARGDGLRHAGRHLERVVAAGGGRRCGAAGRSVRCRTPSPRRSAAALTDQTLRAELIARGLARARQFSWAESVAADPRSLHGGAS